MEWRKVLRRCLGSLLGARSKMQLPTSLASICPAWLAVLRVLPAPIVVIFLRPHRTKTAMRGAERDKLQGVASMTAGRAARRGSLEYDAVGDAAVEGGPFRVPPASSFMLSDMPSGKYSSSAPGHAPLSVTHPCQTRPAPSPRGCGPRCPEAASPGTCPSSPHLLPLWPPQYLGYPAEALCTQRSMAPVRERSTHCCWPQRAYSSAPPRQPSCSCRSCAGPLPPPRAAARPARCLAATMLPKQHFCSSPPRVPGLDESRSTVQYIPG